MSGMVVVVVTGVASLSVAGLTANRFLQQNRQRARRRARRRQHDAEALANWKALQDRQSRRN